MARPPRCVFDLPADVPHVWVATAIVATGLLGLAASLPTTTPARAGAVAETVDAVAAAPHPTTARHPIDAGAIHLTPRTVAVRTAAGVSHARLGHGPVTPVPPGGRLARVLHGVPPRALFETPEVFRAALERARQRTHDWRAVAGPVVVRRLSWEGVDVTLVGA